MQKYLEDLVSGLGTIKLAAQGGMTYGQFVDLSEVTVCIEAEKKLERISNEMAELKRNNISLADYCSANFGVMNRFAVEFADNNTITFNCEEVTNRPNASQEKIEETKKLFYTSLFETISHFLDLRAEKALIVQQTQAQ